MSVVSCNLSERESIQTFSQTSWIKSSNLTRGGGVMDLIQILVPAVLFLTQSSAQPFFHLLIFKRMTFNWSVLCGDPAGFRLRHSLGLSQDREALVSAWTQQTDGISLSQEAQPQFSTVITNSFLLLKHCPYKRNPIPALLDYRQKWGTYFCHRDQLDGVIMRPEWIHGA